MARYSPTSPPYTSDIQQLERYLQRENEEVRASTDDIYTLAKFSLENFVPEAYLSMAGVTPYPLTLSATWQTLLWDTVNFTNNKSVYPNLPNGMNFTDDAVWRMSLLLHTTFAEVNAGRTIKLRAYNTTTGSANGNEVWFAVGRNTPGLTMTMSWLSNIPVDLLSQNIRLEISTADTFTSFQVERAAWEVNNVAKYQGTNPITSLEKKGKY